MLGCRRVHCRNWMDYHELLFLRVSCTAVLVKMSSGSSPGSDGGNNHKHGHSVVLLCSRSTRATPCSYVHCQRPPQHLRRTKARILVHAGTHAHRRTRTQGHIAWDRLRSSWTRSIENFRRHWLASTSHPTTLSGQSRSTHGGRRRRGSKHAGITLHEEPTMAALTPPV
jgi:hypothetical protein